MWSYIMDLRDNSSFDFFASVKVYRRLVFSSNPLFELAISLDTF